MIMVLSPEHAFEAFQAYDGPWWMNEALYPDHIRKECTSKQHDENKPKSTTATATADAKPSAKTVPEYSKMPCRPNNCKVTFQPCRPRRSYNRSARCSRQASNHQELYATKAVEKNKIHYHQETTGAAKMSLDVTGFTLHDIVIQVEHHVVSIRGKRTNKLGDVFVLDRKFRLNKNTASVNGVTATLEDGILELTVPKKPKSAIGPRTIPITISSIDSKESPSKDGENVNNAAKGHEEHDIVTIADSTEAAEDPRPMEVSSPDKEQEKEQEPIVVETIQEDETNTEKEDDKNSESGDSNNRTIVAKSSEDEAWEEVM